MKILAIDDDVETLNFIAEALDQYEVARLEDPRHAIVQLNEDAVYDLILCDIRFPETTGFEFLNVLKEMDNSPPVVLITGSSDVQLTIRAFREGADDYLMKPFDVKELLSVVEAYAQTMPVKDEDRIQEFNGIVGQTDQMLKVYNDIEKAAKADDITVLVFGETGTGKELVSRAIHSSSARGEAPFVAVNCSAVTESLFDSEMFGHVKGAFTDAKTDKKGVFEDASDGFVMLDEVNSLPLAMQAKINRTIEYKEIRKVGASRSQNINARIVAATNVDINELVEKDLFRKDLYYRLNAFTIVIPPLRDRKDDIPLLCEHFIKKSGKEVSLSREAIQALLRYDWPGNVRELKHSIERAMLFAEGDEIGVDDLPTDITQSKSHALSLAYMASLSYNEVVKASKDLCVMQYLDVLLRKYNGNVAQASSQAGLSRQALHRIMKEFNVSGSSYRNKS